MITFIIGSGPDFLAWCARRGISPPAHGIRHIPDAETASRLSKPLAYELVTLPSASPLLLNHLRLAGFRFPPDPDALAAAEREKLIDQWEERLEQWHHDHTRHGPVRF